MKLSSLTYSIQAATQNIRTICVKTGQYCSCKVKRIDPPVGFEEKISGLNREQLQQIKKSVSFPGDAKVKETCKTHANQTEVAKALAIKLSYQMLQENFFARMYLFKHGPKSIDHFSVRCIAGDDSLEAILKSLGYQKESKSYEFPSKRLQGMAYHHPGPAIPSFFTTHWTADMPGSPPLDQHTHELADWLQQSRTPMNTGTLSLIQNLDQHQELSSFHAETLVNQMGKYFTNNYPVISLGDLVRLRDHDEAALAWIATNGQAVSHMAVTMDEVELHQFAANHALPVHVGSGLQQVTTVPEDNEVASLDNHGDYQTVHGPGSFFEACFREEGFRHFDHGNMEAILTRVVDF